MFGIVSGLSESVDDRVLRIVIMRFECLSNEKCLQFVYLYRKLLLDGMEKLFLRTKDFRVSWETVINSRKIIGIMSQYEAIVGASVDVICERSQKIHKRGRKSSE